MREFRRWLREAAVLSILFITVLCFRSGLFTDAIGALVNGTTVMADAHAQERMKTSSLTKLRVEPLYRSVRLTWKVKRKGDGPLTFEIYRSMAKADEPYTLVTSIVKKPGLKKYKYIDKNLPVEENYFYKIVIPETKETFGPLQVRPPFSLPTT